MWLAGEGALPPGLPGLDAVSLGQMSLATAQGRSLGRAGAFESHGAWCLRRPHSAMSVPRSPHLGCGIPPDGSSGHGASFPEHLPIRPCI